MTIADINNALKGQLPNIVLSPATFQQDAQLTPLLRQYFPDSKGSVAIGGVTAANYSFDEANGVIKFSGVGQGGPFDQMNISSVVIKIISGAIQISISASAADGWTIHSAFAAINAPVLQVLPFQAPNLYWATYDSDPDETIKGFYFEGKLDFVNGPLAILSAFLPGLQTPDIWGQFDMVGSDTGDVVQFVPSGTLTIDMSNNNATVGPFTFQGPVLKIFSNPNFNTNDKVWQSDSYVQISTSVKFLKNIITFQANIKDLDSDITFDASMSEPIGAALSDLISFVGGADLSVPNFTIKSPGDMMLKDFGLVYSPKGVNKIKLITLEVGTAPNEQWTLWSNYAVLSNIDLLFHITPGSGTTKTVVDGQFSGQIDGWLNLRARFATDGNYLFYGGLAQPTTISKLYQLFTQSAPPDLPDLTIDTFYFQLNINTQAAQTQYGYAGDLTLTGEWPIVDQPKFSLDGLLFKVNHDPGGNTTIEAGGIMEIQEYSLSVDGQYVTDQGWTLSGDLDLKDEKKSLSDIAGKIDQTFKSGQSGSKSIPNFLTAWQVQSLHTDFNTKSKNFNFNIDIRNADAPGLDLNFGVHLTHTDTSYTKEFDAVATYVTPPAQTPKINVEFDLVIQEEDTTGPPASKKFTLLGTYKATTPPTLADLLQAISQHFQIDANLPQELQLNAEADGFALKIQQTDDDPKVLELAGEFSIQIEGSNLNIYFAYTNEVASDADFKNRITVDGKPAYVFGATLGGVFDLSKLPVVGKIPGVDKLAIDKLGFFYTDADLSQDEKANFEVPQVSGPGQLAPTPAQSVVNKKGFNLVAVFGKKGADNTAPIDPMGTMNIPVGTGTPTSQPGFSKAPAQPASPIHWLDLNKTFGPVSLKQVGLNYSNGEATIGISGGMTLGGFMLDLQGLSVTFPMPLPKKPAGGTVSFDLDGLALNINKGGLQLSGGFLKAIDPDKTVSYYGELMVQFGEFGFKAVGGYSPNANPASFFIFANIEVPLGGPPFLFVTGLSGGFGINRSLILPTVDNLSGCVLLPGGLKNPPKPDATPAEVVAGVLPQLESMFANKPGEYWVAIGVQFTSFEMIQAFALVTVAFGVDLQIGVIGTCSMSFPPDENAVVIAYVEIDLVATFTASSGLLAVDGRLSPASYIFGGFAHLSGGFAFYTWFDGPHKGEFVVSLGGYHPLFDPPKYYPTVPRLSIAFGLGPFQVLGQSYFALTPGAMMAGISLAATWKTGPLKVWFDIGADFLIEWAPFHYEADVYVHLGISLDLGLFTISIHVGADLYIWGPPFGGRADVDLSVISFTIHFGADHSVPPPVGWDSFKTKFLPQDSQPAANALRAFAAAPGATPKTLNIIKADVNKGLVDKNVSGYDWVLDPNHFQILTNSTIPSNYAAWNPANPPVKPADANVPNVLAQYRPPSGQPLLTYPDNLPTYPDDPTLLWNPDVHIKPMGKDNVQSYQTVTLYQRAENEPKGTFTIPINDISLQPILLDSSMALWGKPDTNGVIDPNNKLAKSALTGFMISPIPRHPDAVSNVPLILLLFQPGYESKFAYTAAAPDTRYTVNGSIDSKKDLEITIGKGATEQYDNENYILSTLTQDWVTQQRNAVLNDLINNNDFQTYTPEEVVLTKMATVKSLTDWPVVALMGA